MFISMENFSILKKVHHTEQNSEMTRDNQYLGYRDLTLYQQTQKEDTQTELSSSKVFFFMFFKIFGGESGF